MSKSENCGMNYNDLATFCNQMAQLSAAQTGHVDSLLVIEKHIKNRRLKKCIRNIIVEVANGEDYYKAFYNNDKYIPSLLRSAIMNVSNENNETEMWYFMGKLYESMNDMKLAIKRNFYYPLIVMLTAIAVVASVMIAIFPRIIAMFVGMNIVLPAFTRWMLNASEFLRYYFVTIIVCILVIGLVLILLSQFKWGKIINSIFKLNIPIFGKLNKSFVYAKITLIMNTLLTLNMPLKEALIATSESMGDYEVIREDLNSCIEKMSSGTSFSKSINDSIYLSKTIIEMSTAGEEAGDLYEVYEGLSLYYASSFYSDAGRTMLIVETIAVILMVFLVGGLLFSVIRPVLNFYDLINGI